MKTVWKILATFFGIGYFPVAPATATSLVVVFLYKFLLCTLSWPLYSLLFVVLFFSGVFASNHYSAYVEEKDPRNIVIDEVCGQLLVLFLVPASWPVLLIGFFLFRLFDIIKPYPVKKAEELPEGWGIMIDDIIAGMYAAIILNVYLVFK